MFSDFMDGDMLRTFLGLTTAVTVIVQFTKTVVKKRFGDCLVRLYVLLVALVLTFVFARVGGGVGGILLTIVNAFLIAAASMGGYEVLADPMALKTRR